LLGFFFLKNIYSTRPSVKRTRILQASIPLSTLFIKKIYKLFAKIILYNFQATDYDRQNYLWSMPVMAKISQSPDLPNLEASLAEINALIDKMEQGELNLEQSLAQFERGVTLIKHAQNILQTAEQKVQILMKKNGNEKLIDYEGKEE
jgi:exodeoxyribonuclease VII small subunit